MDIDLLEQLIAPGDGINSSIRPCGTLLDDDTPTCNELLSGVASVSFAHSTVLLSRNTECSNPIGHPFRHPRLQAQVHVRTEIP